MKLIDPEFLFDHYFYFNLHKRLWSAKSVGPAVTGRAIKGRVTGHVDTALLFGVTCKVSEAGRLRERRKNVHAGLVARTACINPAGTIFTTESTWRIRYNPYDLPYFHNPYNRTPISGCPVVWLGTTLLDSGVTVPSAYYAQYAYYAGDTVLLHFDDCVDWARRNDFTGHIDRHDGVRLYWCDGRFDCSEYSGCPESPVPANCID